MNQIRFCENCRVQITGERERCPLCQGELTFQETGAAVDSALPVIPSYTHQHSRLFQSLKFTAIVGVVLSVLVNILLLPTTGWWAQFVTFGVFCVWLLLDIAVRKRNNIPKATLWLAVLASALAVLWDLLTGWRGWSLDFAVPIVFVACMIAMGVVVMVMRVRIDHNIVYFCLDALFCIIPLIFLLTQTVRVLLPSLLCVAVSVLSLSALSIFFGRSMRSELRRRLHL